MTIIRGTTATIEYTFEDITPSDIRQAYLSIKQLGRTVIERTLETADVGETLSWTLTQEESLKLNSKTQTVIYLDYVLDDGTRGAGVTEQCDVFPTGKDEVI